MTDPTPGRVFEDLTAAEQATLREMREALDALPVKQLAFGAEREGTGKQARYCVLGALAQHRGPEVIEQLVSAKPHSYWAVLDTTERLTEAAYQTNDAVCVNLDEDSAASCRARWRFMRKWIDAQLPPEPKPKRPAKTARKKARKAAKLAHHCQPDPLVTTAQQIQGQTLAGIH